MVRWLGLVLVAVALVTAGASAQAQTSPVACVPGRATPAAIEGPFFKSGAPQRTSLIEPGLPGVKLVLSGQVFTRTCAPVARARLDFWQADARGAYDNTGYRLRGYQIADGTGHYSLETIVPGEYPGRTRHIHVKVAAPDGRRVTTQLFFPREPANQHDAFFRPELVMQVQDTAGGKAATFDFVLDAQ